MITGFTLSQQKDREVPQGYVGTVRMLKAPPPEGHLRIT